MNAVTLEFLTEQLNLGDQLQAGRETMLEPQDLPGRYGRVVRAVDGIIASAAVVAGGWAVWRHGYVARLTQDLDIVLPADRIDEFQKVALVPGFETVAGLPGTWPKLLHKDTQVQVDLLPEGGQPGTAARPAPTRIGHPEAMGGSGHMLRYIQLPALIELKLAAGRGRDDSDIIELLRVNPAEIGGLRRHLQRVHPDYVVRFDQLVERARDQQDA